MPKSDSTEILFGQPVDGETDVGRASRAGKEIEVVVFSGNSVLNPGSKTDRIESISRVPSPLAQDEVGTIRCIGLNYLQHVRGKKSKWPFRQYQPCSCTSLDPR